MTRQLPPLVPFSEILRTALGMASRRIVEGSRRNAVDALVAGVADTEAASAAFAAWVPTAAAVPVAAAVSRPATRPRLPRQEPRRPVPCRESA